MLQLKIVERHQRLEESLHYVNACRILSKYDIDITIHALRKLNISSTLDQRKKLIAQLCRSAVRHLDDCIASATRLSVDFLMSTQQRQRCYELAVFFEDCEIPVSIIQLLWRQTGSLSQNECIELMRILRNRSFQAHLNFKNVFDFMIQLVNILLKISNQDVTKHLKNLIFCY